MGAPGRESTTIMETAGRRRAGGAAPAGRHGQRDATPAGRRAGDGAVREPRRTLTAAPARPDRHASRNSGNNPVRSYGCLCEPACRLHSALGILALTRYLSNALFAERTVAEPPVSGMYASKSPDPSHAVAPGYQLAQGRLAETLPVVGLTMRRPEGSAAARTRSADSAIAARHGRVAERYADLLGNSRCVVMKACQLMSL